MSRLLQQVTRIRRSRSAWNVAASYFAFGSTSVWALVSIPIVVHFLSKEEIGLWTIVNQMVMYFMWLDMGIGQATARLMAPSLAANNQFEVDDWWTLSIFVLTSMGLLMLLIGWFAAPWLLDVLHVPASLETQALWLLRGTLLFAAIGFPFRCHSGILLVQERFHWVPIMQGVQPWVQLGLFFWGLLQGWGVYSYLLGVGTSQLLSYAAYAWLISRGPHRFHFRPSRLCRTRFRSLMSFSMGVSVSSWLETIYETLPAIVLARCGGLGLIPQFSFSRRCPAMLTNLVRRTVHAFYPTLLSLHLSGNQNAFHSRFRLTAMLTLSLSLGAASMMLLFNRVIIELLAGQSFYAGAAPNIWFAASLILVPLAQIFKVLMPLGGNMGKTTTVSLISIAVGIAAYVLAFRYFGLAGLAAVTAFLPMVYSMYAYYHGSKSCGYVPNRLCGEILCVGLVLTAAVVGFGWLSLSWGHETLTFILFSHVMKTPSLGEVAAASGLGLVALIMGLFQWRRMRKSPSLVSAAPPNPQF